MYWSYKRLPELEGLSNEDKQLIIKDARWQGISLKEVLLTIVSFSPAYIMVAFCTPETVHDEMLRGLFQIVFGVLGSSVIFHVLILNFVTRPKIRGVCDDLARLKTIVGGGASQTAERG